MHVRGFTANYNSLFNPDVVNHTPHAFPAPSTFTLSIVVPEVSLVPIVNVSVMQRSTFGKYLLVLEDALERYGTVSSMG